MHTDHVEMKVHVFSIFHPVTVQVADLKYNTLANGHGPILRYNVEQLVTNYRDWSLAVEKGSTQVCCSMHNGRNMQCISFVSCWL